MSGCFLRTPVCFGFILALAVTLSPACVFGEMVFVVPETISTPAVWTKENSPYVLLADVQVTAGVSLTLEPGTMVKFAEGSLLSVSGTLQANGTANDPIYFTSIHDDVRGGDTDGGGDAIAPSSSDYWGIDILFGEATLTHSVFSYSEGGLFSVGSPMSLSDVLFEHMGDALFFSQSTAVLSSTTASDISGSAFQFSNSSVVGTHVFIEDVFDGDALALYGGSLSLTESRVRRIGSGSALGLYGTVAVVNTSVFEQGLESGLELYDASSLFLGDSVVQGFGYGALELYDSSAFVHKTRLLQSGSGMVLYDASGGDIAESSISGNLGAGIEQYGTGALTAVENWWGDASGPYHSTNQGGLGDSIYGEVTFVPWLTSDPFAAPVCCSSVLFIPGLEASRLYTQGSIFENQLWEPNREADVETLFLDANGSSIATGVYTKDIIDESNIVRPSVLAGLNIYKKFIGFMDTLVASSTIGEWRAFPYDWRRDLPDILATGSVIKQGDSFEVLNLADEVEILAAGSKTGKVTLIGHSNGGLLGKLLIQELERQGKSDLVDMFIMVAVPQLGTPSAIAALLHGDEQELPKKLGVFMPKPTARGLGEYMRSAYNLLPSAGYFASVVDPVIEFDDSLLPMFDFSAYGHSIASSSELSDFLSGGSGAREKPPFMHTSTPNVLELPFIERASLNHENLDSWIPPAGVEVIQIAGWGLPTLRGIRYSGLDYVLCLSDGKCRSEFIWEREPILVDDGDRTVVIPSAVAMNVKTYYVDLPSQNFLLKRNREHADILEVKDLEILISQLLSKQVNDGSLPDDVSLQKPLSDTLGRLQYSVHSPVSIGVTDSEGNYTGLLPNPDSTSDFALIKEEIPNSYYMEFGEGKYVGVTGDTPYEVHIQGTGVGTFTLKEEITKGGSVLSSRVFGSVPVTPLTKAQLVSGAGTTTLSLDVNGDGTFEFSLTEASTTDPIIFLQIMKETIKAFDLRPHLAKTLLSKIDRIITLIRKGKIRQVTQRIEQFTKQLEHRLGRLEKKKKKPSEFSREEVAIMIGMLEELLDNLK